LGFRPRAGSGRRPKERERKKDIKKTNKKKKKKTCTQEEYDRVGGIKSY
jgi:hypothetical protein